MFKNWSNYLLKRLALLGQFYATHFKLYGSCTAGYRLNFRVKMDKSRTGYNYWVSSKNTTHRPKTRQWHTELSKRWRKRGGADTRPGRPDRHKPMHRLTRQILTETDLSECTPYTAILVWRDAMCKSPLKLTAMLSSRQNCGHQTVKKLHHSIWLQNLVAYLSNESTRQKCRIWLIWGSIGLKVWAGAE